MWEARAASGRADELLDFVLERAAAGAAVYRSEDDRVVVIDDAGGGPPDPPPDLLARSAHRWRFTRVR